MTIPLPDNTDANGNMPFAHNMLLTCSMLDLLKHLSELDNELDAIIKDQSLLSQCEQLEALSYNIADHDMLLETLFTRPLENGV